jgi:glycosyltransferase involved in cell wall biosynthesis
MPHALVTALIDLTMLSTPSRQRGIGRYAADLACALDDVDAGVDAARAPDWTDVRVRAIERFDWIGPATITGPRSAVRRIAEDARRFSHAQWAYRVRLRLASIVRRIRADVVHSPHPDATPLGSLGCPRIVTCHDLIAMRAPDHYGGWRDGWRWGRRHLDARRYHSADHIIAVSTATASDLVALLRIPARKITVVHHGVDTVRFSPMPVGDDEDLRRRHGFGDRRYLLFVGAADWRKNAEGMLRALAIVRGRPGTSDIVLAWAGVIDSQDLAAVRAHARTAAVADAVMMLGYVPDGDLAALMRGALALLFVSRIEGFGYPLVEAMACGCPVIGSDRPAIVEMAGDAASLVDPDRPEAIAEAIGALAGDVSQRRRLSERGVKRSQHFTLRRMAQQTADVYRQVATRPRR